ncbi:flagellar hook protein FlgE [Marinomonas mediterranea]|jgi:fagellar hook-basal body proteins|uniref:Flagellar hook protein FlgE n=1 Tax=Marinomonas mediterranea (strain ATCC 700492 / JCM 21426 / NBRC 103028 / MMB-1) TaxID=717774 RepID=F2K4T8_MARM1|nr:flagellar hook protein FlgE [Marinomonas mediterranea]ADZ92581.1 flagellar hook-basal body protein [Marinomonas mediterranea MMB-1]WCN18623.1 flagellar hook-basal body complex protein [Marinomonas mediterranea MMB-1]
MGFNTALSGIKASADYLGVTGNNIANADTTGFKKSRIEFGDLYNTNVIGSGSSNTIGSGVSVNNVAQDFSAGNYNDTGNNLDVAIDGSGFFVVDQGGVQTYTRAGDFKLDEEGNLVTNDGGFVQGYNSVNGSIGGTLENLKVPTERIAPQATTSVEIQANLNSSAEDVPPYISQSFDPSDTDTYTYAQTVTDSANNVVTLYYAKSETPNTYQVYMTVNGELQDDSGNAFLGDYFVTFDDADGSLTNTAYSAVYSGTTEPTVGDIPTVAPITPTTIPLNYADATATVNNTPLGDINLGAGLDPSAGELTTSEGHARESFDPQDANTYTYNNTNTIYDSLGEAHTVGYYFIKQGEDNTWEVKVTVDGETTDANGNLYLPEDTIVKFDSSGNLTGTFTGYEPYTTPVPATDLTITGWDPTNLTGELEISFDDSTQYAITSTDTFSQDGFAAGELQGVSFDEDGFLVATYTNQQTATLGQIALATFDNTDGLNPSGDTGWVASSSSGAANIGKANTGTLGSIKGGSLEESNVDLTSELVALIEAQRNYQANSKTLETENTVTQTIINLR